MNTSTTYIQLSKSRQAAIWRLNKDPGFYQLVVTFTCWGLLVTWYMLRTLLHSFY